MARSFLKFFSKALGQRPGRQYTNKHRTSVRPNLVANGKRAKEHAVGESQARVVTRM